MLGYDFKQLIHFTLLFPLSLIKILIELALQPLVHQKFILLMVLCRHYYQQMYCLYFIQLYLVKIVFG